MQVSPCDKQVRLGRLVEQPPSLVNIVIRAVRCLRVRLPRAGHARRCEKVNF